MRRTGTDRIPSYRERIIAMQTEIAARSAAKVDVVPIQTTLHQSLGDTLVDVHENQHSLNHDIQQQSSQDEKEHLRTEGVDDVGKCIDASSRGLSVVVVDTQYIMQPVLVCINQVGDNMCNSSMSTPTQDLRNIVRKIPEVPKSSRPSDCVITKIVTSPTTEHTEISQATINDESAEATNLQAHSMQETLLDEVVILSPQSSVMDLDRLQSIEQDCRFSASLEDKKEPDHRQDRKCEGLIGNQFQPRTKKVKPSMKNKTQQEMSSSTQLYQDSCMEHNECEQTNLARDVSDIPTTNAERCESYSDRHQTGKIPCEERRLSTSDPSNILDSEKRVMTIEPSIHKGVIKLKEKKSYNNVNQVGDNMCISSSSTPSQVSKVITKQVKSEAMTSNEWSLENLSVYAFSYIFRKNKIITTSNTFDTSPSSYEGLPRWREFRRHLFKEIRRRVHVVVSEGRHPDYALKDLPVPITKLAHRFNLLKLALQIEASTLDGPVCAWAVRQLVIQLAHAVDRQCRKVESLRPRAITARGLAPAVVVLQNIGVNVKCTQEQLVHIWQRLCALKTWQLYKLSRVGDKPDSLPPAERLDAHDWSVLDTLLLHDNNQKMELVTMSSLQSLECYRSLVLLVRLQMKLPLWVRRAPPWRYSGYQGWAHVHARYNATGRTASIILLQRRWYQLRLLTRTAVEAGVKPLHPLLQLVLTEFPSVIKEHKNNWSELVRRGNCDLVADEQIAKQERKRPCNYEIAILENLETVNEINEYISQRINLTFSRERHKCELWEQCNNRETCKSNVHNALHTKVDDRNRTENNIVSSNISKTAKVATLEALQRIDPTTAQVTVVVENDSDEAVSPDITSVKDSSKINTQQNELSGSRDICDEKQSSKKLRAVAKLPSPNTYMPLDFTDRENKEVGEPQATLKRVADNLIKISVEKELDTSETEIDEDRMDNIKNNGIDSKLLYLTYLKLTRIDKTSTWVKHAKNNKINLRRAGLLTRYDDSNKLPVCLQDNTIDNDSTIDDSGITNDYKDKSNSETKSIYNPIFKGVSENVLRNRRNHRFLKLCKPAVVRLRKLRDSEIPRRGRIVKKVELSDIDEVRRINSNILTAQVKPISLEEQRRDSMSDEEEPGSSSESKFMKLSKELRLLQKDMKALFNLQPVDREAIINEAVHSDENKLYLLKARIEPNTSPFISSNVFLDGGEIMLDDVDQTLPVHIKRNPRKKNKVERVMKSIEEPIRLNAYEEWERQKRIANKYFEFGNKMYEQGNKKPNGKSKSKAVKESRPLKQKPPNVSAELAPYKEPRLTGQEILTVSTQLATNNQPRLTEHGLDPVSVELPPVSEPRLTEQRPSMLSAASNHCNIIPARNETECYQNVLPRPPITIVNSSDQNNLQHLLTDTFLTKLLNAPPKEPNVDSLRYMILSPMEKTNQVVKVNDIIKSMTPVEVEDDNEPVLTPMITGVCSLAETETIEDNVANRPDIEMMESVTTQNNGNSDAGGRNSDPNLTMCLTPTHRNIMVKVGHQLICNTTEASSNEVSSCPNNEEPVAPPANQTLLQKFLMCPSVPPKPKCKIKIYQPTKANGQVRLQKTEGRKGRKRGQSAGDSHTKPENSAFNVDGGKHSGTGVSINKKKRKPYGPVPHIGSKLKTEFTTPEEYVKTDRRKLLTVVKLDLRDPAWVIGGKYIILTEQNLPCSHPGFWTIGRDPPGRCQFLLWPKNVQSTNVNEFNQNSHEDKHHRSTGFSMTKNPKFDSEGCDIQVDRESKIFSETENVGEVIVDEQENIMQSYVNANVNSENIQEETVLSKKQNSEVLAMNCVENSKVFINQQRQVLYEDDSDSDSESNRLQIVEEDVTDFNNTNITTSNFNNSGTTGRHNNNSEDLSKKQDNLTTVQLDEDSNTVKIIDKNYLLNHTYSKSKDKDTNTNKSKGIIKVKSFASISRMETQPLTRNINESPDVIEKGNKFYKKLLEPSSTESTTTYALMLSAVTNPEQCDRLLREGTPLQVLERYRGRVQPLKVSRGESGGPIYLSHYDSHFLNDLVHRLQDFNVNYVQMYECQILD